MSSAGAEAKGGHQAYQEATRSLLERAQRLVNSTSPDSRGSGSPGGGDAATTAAPASRGGGSVSSAASTPSRAWPALGGGQGDAVTPTPPRQQERYSLEAEWRRQQQNDLLDDTAPPPPTQAGQTPVTPPPPAGIAGTRLFDSKAITPPPPASVAPSPMQAAGPATAAAAQPFSGAPPAWDLPSPKDIDELDGFDDHHGTSPADEGRVLKGGGGVGGALDASADGGASEGSNGLPALFDAFDKWFTGGGKRADIHSDVLLNTPGEAREEGGHHVATQQRQGVGGGGEGTAATTTTTTVVAEEVEVHHHHHAVVKSIVRVPPPAEEEVHHQRRFGGTALDVKAVGAAREPPQVEAVEEVGRGEPEAPSPDPREERQRLLQDLKAQQRELERLEAEHQQRRERQQPGARAGQQRQQQTEAAAATAASPASGKTPEPRRGGAGITRHTIRKGGGGGGAPGGAAAAGVRRQPTPRRSASSSGGGGGGGGGTATTAAGAKSLDDLLARRLSESRAGGGRGGGGGGGGMRGGSPAGRRAAGGSPGGRGGGGGAAWDGRQGVAPHPAHSALGGGSPAAAPARSPSGRRRGSVGSPVRGGSLQPQGAGGSARRALRALTPNSSPAAAGQHRGAEGKRSTYTQLKAAQTYQAQHHIRQHQDQRIVGTPPRGVGGGRGGVAAAPAAPVSPSGSGGYASDGSTEVPDLEALRLELQQKLKTESGALIKKMIATADKLHSQRVMLRRLQSELEASSRAMDATEASLETESHAAALRSQRDELQRQYKHSLFLAAKRRQAAKVRRVQGLAQRRDQLEGEVSSVRDVLRRAEGVISSLGRKKGELEAHLDDLLDDGEPYRRKTQQLRECEAKLEWLKMHFPVETTMADRSEEDSRARQMYAEHRSKLQERLAQLDANTPDAALHIESTEIRCRRRAADLWRQELQQRWTLSAADVLHICRTLRATENPGASIDSEGAIERQIDSIGSAEVVEAWLQEVCPDSSTADMRDDLEAFLDAFAFETDELAADYRERVHGVEEQAAGSTRSNTAAELERLEAEEAHRTEQHHAEMARLASEAQWGNPAPDTQEDWQTLICAGMPEERSGFIACTKRAHAMVSATLERWRREGGEEKEQLVRETQRAVAEAERAQAKTLETAAQEGERVAELERQLDALAHEEDVAEEAEAEQQGGSLKVQSQMLAALDDEIVCAEELVANSSERKMRARHTRHQDLLTKLSKQKVAVDALVREEKDLEMRMTALRAKYEAKHVALTRARISADDDTDDSLSTKIDSYARRHGRKGKPPPPPPPPPPPLPHGSHPATPATSTTTTPRRKQRKASPPPPPPPPPVEDPPAALLFDLPTVLPDDSEGGFDDVDGLPDSMHHHHHHHHQQQHHQHQPQHHQPQQQRHREGGGGSGGAGVPALDLPDEVQLFGPSSPVVPIAEALAELQRIDYLVREGSWVWKKLKTGYGQRRLRLTADLGRTEVRKEGKKVPEDFMRSAHMTKVFLAKHDPSSPGFPFVVQLRDSRMEFLCRDTAEAECWVSVLRTLIKHRSSLFFLKYNMRQLLR